MSRAGMESAGEPLRGVERLEWARVALEEAVGRMVKNPGESVFLVAVCSRYRELQNIRIPVEELVASKQREGEPPIEARVCPQCLRGVATVMQHYTGTDYMCVKKPQPSDIFSFKRPVGRPPNPKIDPAPIDGPVRRTDGE